MNFEIWMGVPEMRDLWNSLKKKTKDNTATKDEAKLFKKWSQAVKHLAEDPFYPGLQSHEISDLSDRYGEKVWQSYLENKKSGAMRMFWVYGPGKNAITIIGLDKHPENQKRDGYSKVRLSDKE